MFGEDELRTQIFVDDPATLIVGDVVAARRRAALLLWWWLALGLQISWKKGTFAKTFKWIGVEVDLREKGAIIVTIPEAFANQVASLAEEILKSKAVSVDKVQQLAGKAGWAAGVAPVLWAHIAPLWAACADAERSVEGIGGKAGHKGKDVAHRRRRAKVGTCRVRPSLVWLIALFRSQGGILVKKVPVHRWVGPPRARIYADASPWGFGAFVSIDGVAVECLHGVWDMADCDKFSLEIGDCRGQAVWETLVILIAGVGAFLARACVRHQDQVGLEGGFGRL